MFHKISTADGAKTEVTLKTVRMELVAAAILLLFAIATFQWTHAKVRDIDPPKAETEGGFCIIFVNADDPFGKEWSLKTGTALQNWPDYHRLVIANIFSQIQQRAPGLLYRACNGGNLRLVLDATSRGSISMITHPNCIECNADILKDGELCECLVHELIHYLDTRGSISSTRQWNHLVAQRMSKFRQKYDFFGDVFSEKVDPRANEFQLASCYSALGAGEALAEYTTAMVMSDWQPPAEVKTFIEQNVLSMPTEVDTQRQLLQNSYATTLRQQHEQSIALDTEVLKLNPRSLPARLELASLWLIMDEPEIALAHVTEALRIIKQNELACFEPIGIQARQLYGNACTELALRQLKAHDYESALFHCNEAIAKNPETLWLTERSDGCIINAQELRSTVAVYHTTRAMVQSELKRYVLSLLDYRRAIQLDPNCAAAYAGEAGTFERLGKPRRALEAIQKAIGLNPRESQYFETRAIAYTNMRLFRKAIDSYTTAISLSPDVPRFYKSRAELYHALSMSKPEHSDRRKYQSLMAKINPLPSKTPILRAMN